MWLKEVVRAPWPLLVQEAWLNRSATAGSLRLPFMDLRRPPQRDPAGLERVLTEALERLSRAGQGFGELVTSHVRLVVAVDHVVQAYVLSSRAWGSTFQDPSRTNGHILACKLVWAAAAIRLARDAKAFGRAMDRDAIRDACWQAQQRYLRQFPDAEEWIDYMNPNRDSGGSAAGAA